MFGNVIHECRTAKIQLIHAILKYFSLVFVVLLSVIGNCQNDSIKVVSWNVFQRPAILFDNQQSRLIPTASALLKEEADVICLQEMFRKKSVKRMRQLLLSDYPYQIRGPKKKRGLFKTNSGLTVYSKHPIIDSVKYVYQNASRADAMASKGVLGIKIMINDQKIWALNTHMQADSSMQAIRDLQYQEIKEWIDTLTEPYLFCGDFNTQYSNAKSIENLTSKLNLHISTQIGSSLKNTANFSDNGLYKVKGKTEPERIDFVGVEKNSNLTPGYCEIKRPSEKSNGQLKYLSDHALLSRFILLKSH